MDIIISIKPKYVSLILNKTKKYEFRKKIFLKKIDRVYIYSSSPQKKIIGFFNFTDCVYGDILDVWNKTKDFAGITFEEYSNYFKNHDIAYGIQIKDLEVWEHPIDPKKVIDNFIPPQSFCYLYKRI